MLYSSADALFRRSMLHLAASFFEPSPPRLSVHRRRRLCTYGAGASVYCAKGALSTHDAGASLKALS